MTEDREEISKTSGHFPYSNRANFLYESMLNLEYDDSAARADIDYGMEVLRSGPIGF